MDSLKATMVDAAFRPVGEEPRSLLNFVDETGVDTTRSALKDTIDQAQVYRNP
jgi:autophagy-related protein 17